jgi:hypothetical protein
VATLVFVTLVTGAFTLSSLVLASGVLPIPSLLLLLGAAIAGVAGSLPAAIFGTTRTRFLSLAVIAVAWTVIATACLFLYFQRAGLTHAERYAEGWARAIAAAHEHTGQWPRRLEDVARPPAHDIPWPYRSSCRGTVCDTVGGYTLVYLPEKTPPILRVARRELRVEWDWSRREWVSR